MIQILGLITLFILIFGALLTAGDGILHALGIELVLICGAAFGILIISNASNTSARALSGFYRAVRGQHWIRSDYLSLLMLLNTLCGTARRGGIIAIEADIESPRTSERFISVPRILAHDGARELIFDTFRLMSLDLSDKQRAKDAMQRAIEREYEHEMRPVNALHALADALPALGIVAAVIGIIRAMGVIDQSPSVIGAMMAAALLGTFLGVFLAYGVVGPVASRLGQIVEADERFLLVIQTVLTAHLDGVAPLTAIELGRAEVPAELSITSDKLRHALQASRFDPQRTEAA